MIAVAVAIVLAAMILAPSGTGRSDGYRPRGGRGPGLPPTGGSGAQK